MFIITWLAIGIVAQIVWTIVMCVVFDEWSTIKDAFSSFTGGLTFVLSYTLIAAINVVSWPIAIGCDIYILKKLFNGEEL